MNNHSISIYNFSFLQTHVLFSYTYFKDQSYGTKNLKYDFYKFYPFHEPGYMYLTF